MGITGEEVGYRDAIRQVERNLHRRLRTLEESLEEETDEKEELELKGRLDEVRHMIHVVESLHR